MRRERKATGRRTTIACMILAGSAALPLGAQSITQYRSGGPARVTNTNPAPSNTITQYANPPGNGAAPAPQQPVVTATPPVMTPGPVIGSGGQSQFLRGPIAAGPTGYWPGNGGYGNGGYSNGGYANPYGPPRYWGNPGLSAHPVLPPSATASGAGISSGIGQRPVAHPVLRQPVANAPYGGDSAQNGYGSAFRRRPSGGTIQNETQLRSYARIPTKTPTRATYSVVEDPIVHPAPAPAEPSHEHHRHHDDDQNFVYSLGPTTVLPNGTIIVGGFYYAGYCNSLYNGECYPSVFSFYGGLPDFIYNPSVVVLSEPPQPVYVTNYIPFPAYGPSYDYGYSAPPVQDDQSQQAPADNDQAPSGDTAAAPKADSYQASFLDIEKAWNTGEIGLLTRHLWDADTKVAVSLKGHYKYSIPSSDFQDITRDAFDRLSTLSFKFTRLRIADNGDVTAYATHRYRGTAADASTRGSDSGATVPFDTAETAPAPHEATPGPEKTVYVSYTLHKRDGVWYIIAIDSSPKPLVPEQADAS